MAYFFMHLLDVRWNALSKEGYPIRDAHGAITVVPQAMPMSYFSNRVLHEYPELEVDALNPLRTVTPESLARQLRAIAVKPGQEGAPFLAIVSSEDDPVVGNDGGALDTNLGAAKCSFSGSGLAIGSAPVCVFKPKVGGHIAFAVINQPLARRFLGTYLCWGGNCVP